MIHYQECPVCGSASISRVLVAADHTVSNENFEIWQCAHCSLRFTQDVPERQEIGRYYQSENYISHSETSKGLVNWLYHRVRKLTLSIKRKFIEGETGVVKGNLLDVGAGTGAFLHYMQQAGWTTEGLEPDSGAIARAASLYGLHLKPSDELFQLPENKFDAITLWHVLEHVHDLRGYLQQMKKLLKREGKLFIAVPNYTSKDAEMYGSHWAAYDVPRHLYHFSPASMQELTRMHGFELLKMQPMWFDSFYVSMLSEKYRSGRPNLLKGFVNGFKSNVKAWSHGRKASSVIYVLGHSKSK